MKYFKILSPPQVTEDLKALLNNINDQIEDKNELIGYVDIEKESYFEQSLSVPQTCKIPLVAELTTLPDQIRQVALLVLLENRYFLKNYKYEVIAAVINSLTRESLPLSTESFIEHYSISWNHAFPVSGKSKSVWLFHHDCRFWLLLLRIIVKSIENAPDEDKEYLSEIALEKVLTFKRKFKGYGHYPEVSPLICILIKYGSKEIIEKIKEFCKETLPKVYNQFDILGKYPSTSDRLVCLFLQSYYDIPSEKWLKQWDEVINKIDKNEFKNLCNSLWKTYMPTEEDVKKLAHLSGGTLDMEVILGIQRQLYQDFQDMTEYEEFGRNITKASIWSLGLLQQPDNINDLNNFCQKYNQFKEFCRAAIYALECYKTNDSMRVLLNLQRLIKNRELKKNVYEALQKQGASIGLSVDILKDLTVEDGGLDANGLHSWILGRDLLVKLALIDNGSISLKYYDRSSDEGFINEPKLLKTPPKELKAKYEDEFDSIYENHKQLEESIQIQSLRLEEAMCQQRQWDYPVWKDVFENNPVNKNIALRLLWAAYNKDNMLIKYFIYNSEGQFIDINEQITHLSDDYIVKIPHPIMIDNEELLKWNNIFKNKEIQQPFDQLNRKIYYIEDSEKNDITQSERFNSTQIRFDYFQQLMEKLSWKGFSTSDFDESEVKSKDYQNLLFRACLIIDLTGINIWNLSSDVLLKDIFFYKLEKRGKNYKPLKEKSLLKDVNPIVYSETMLDISISTGKEYKKVLTNVKHV